MELSPIAAVLIGLMLAGWTFAAATLAFASRARLRQARASRIAAHRLARMIEHSPAIPLLVRGDGAIEGSPRLAAWLGLDALPHYLSELRSQEGGLPEADLDTLREAVRRTLKTAAPFRLHVTPIGSRRSLAVCGQYADRLVAPQGAALVWWFDFSESDEELAALREEIGLLQGDFAAVLRLFEAAPVAMWFRGPDLGLRIVNEAYARAVNAHDPAEVIGEQIELIEAMEGRSPADIAGEVRSKGASIERVVQATIGGQRRSLRVCDLPLGEEGVAGFAIDIEETETQGRALRAFAEAQRGLLDLLSVAVSQFDIERRLAYANQPFRRLFGLDEAGEAGGQGGEKGLEFHRVLDHAREAGRLPETADFPAWRRKLGTWFGETDPVEQAWTLADGTHLRVVGLPIPDGGLTLLAENRSEQLALSAARDVLLRTRATIIDCLGEALAIFAPDGMVHTCNRRFAELWALPPEYLATSRRAEDLLVTIAPGLADPDARAAIGEAVRAATLERRFESGQARLADGRALQFVATPLPDGNGLLVFHDVSARQAIEAALEERDEALGQADEAHAVFLEELAADLRSDIATIDGAAGALSERGADALGDKAPTHAATIAEAARRLEARVLGLFEQAHPGAEAPTIEASAIELLPLVTVLVRRREAAVEAKDIRLDLRGSPRVGEVHADERQLARAIGIVLDDAIASAPPGGHILVSLARGRQGATIEITGEAESNAGSAASTAARRIIEAAGGRLALHVGTGGTQVATITLP